MLSLCLLWTLSTSALADETGAGAGDSTTTGKLVREIIIDDSGIVLYDEDDTSFVVDDDDDFLRDDYERELRSFSSRSDWSDDETVYFGRDVIVEEDEVVYDDMLIVRGDLEIYGEVVGEIVSILGDVYLYDGSAVTGDILCLGGEVEISPGAEIIGEVTTPSFIPGFGAWSEDWDWNWRGMNFHSGTSIFGGGLYLRLIRTLLFAWIGMLLLSRRIPNLSLAFRYRPWLSLLSGILGLLVAALMSIPALLLIVLLCLTLIGIPVAVLAIIALAGLGIVAWLVPVYGFSRYTFEARGMNRFLSVSIWAVIFWFLSSMGSMWGVFGFVSVLFWLTGFGAMLLSRIGSRDPISH